MTHRTRLAGLAAALVAALAAAPAIGQDRILASARPPATACPAGGPLQVWLLQQSSATDCDNIVSGTVDALCCCINGAWAACVTPSGGSGTVTSVALSVPAEWTVGGSPVTTSGTITISEAAQSANTVYAGPTSGGAAAPGFRAVVDADVPNTITVDLATAASDLTCTNCIGGTEIDESALGAVPTATNALGVSGFTATKCARFDGSGALVAASGDCSAGDTDLDTKVIFDIGDDGGNDSTGLTELSTLHDDYSAMPYAGSNEAQIDFAKIPPYQEYDPDRPSATCWGGTGALCEDFQGNAEALTWRWGNQGTSTQSLVLDRSLLTPQAATTTLRARWTTPPSATNWAITTKFSQVHLSGTGLAGSGPVVLEAGSEATPTAISGIFLQYKNSVPWGSARAYSKTSYTSASTVIGSLVDVHNSLLATSVYAQIRYVTGTKTLTYFVSYNGLHWFAIGSARVLGAGPVSVGYAGETAGASTTHQVLFEWWRLRTDSAGTSGNYECGE